MVPEYAAGHDLLLVAWCSVAPVTSHCGRNAQVQAKTFTHIINCAHRVTAKGPRLFDAFAYNMYNVDGQRAMAVAVKTLVGLRRDTGAAVPVSVGEYSAFSAR